jgi:hypothetical protein
MAESNLFTMLSAYRPGGAATPFENYCTSGLAYFLRRGQRMVTALIAEAAGAASEILAITEVQPSLGGSGVADLVLTFEGGRRVIIEVAVEPGINNEHLSAMVREGSTWDGQPAFIVLGLGNEGVPHPWRPLSWLQIVDALEDDPDRLAKEFVQFILQDVLGLGTVSLDQAITTNRLYALGGAAIRRRFGDRARYVNSASRPIGGRYRYLGTTFGLDGGDMQYWIGLVNEALPLSEHYHFMMASKDAPLLSPADHPRATGDWKWGHWTGAGRVASPVFAQSYDELLARLIK